LLTLSTLLLPTSGSTALARTKSLWLLSLATAQDVTDGLTDIKLDFGVQLS
jgi:hypothetical protein